MSIKGQKLLHQDLFSYLGGDGGSVEVQLGVGELVAGVDREGFGVDLVGVREPARLEGIVALVLLGSDHSRPLKLHKNHISLKKVSSLARRTGSLGQ